MDTAEHTPVTAQPIGTYTSIAVADIRASPYNHRKTFTGLEELGDSILTKGLAQPIVVRPSPPPAKRGPKLDPTAYELVCGERRWRAAKLRDIEHLPAIVRQLEDVEVLELQLIENVQRADVHPLEEADGYRDLLDKHGYTVERIVQRTGKSRSWVYSRLKLCDLVSEAREAFLAGKITTQVAIALARLPDPRLMAEAVSGVLGLAYRELDEAGIDAPGLRAPGDFRNGAAEVEALTNRQALAYLQRRYTLDLGLAKFPTDDPKLLPDVGNCTGCVHRTGNQPDLFGDATSADVCTRPSCFEKKTDAWFAAAAAAAKARGVKVLPSAHGVFNPHRSGDVIDHMSKFVPVTHELTMNDGWRNYEKKAPTLAKALGKDLDKIPRVLVQAPSGAAVELVDREAAVKMIKAAGVLKIERKSAKPDNGEAAARNKLELRRGVVALATPKIASAVAGAFKADSMAEALPWWRWVATEIVNQLGADDIMAVAKALKVEAKREKGVSAYDAPRRGILAEIDSSAATPQGIRYVIAVCLVGSAGASGATWSPKYSNGFIAAAKRWKVDLDKLATDVVADKRAVPATKKPAKAKAGKGKKS